MSNLQHKRKLPLFLQADNFDVCQYGLLIFTAQE